MSSLLGSSILPTVARRFAAATAATHRAAAAVDNLVAGLLDAALTGEEKTALGVALYDQSPRYRDVETLFDWERAWYELDLPAAPARVLVGACGAGREVGWLLAAGYEVIGFEPAPSLLAIARAKHPAARLYEATYEAWSQEPELGGRVDAVVLGWGSVSHVLVPDARDALLRACASACPDGPILLSYWPRSTRGGGGARAVGGRVGRWLAGIRNIDARASGDVYDPTIGFVHGFDAAELAVLADLAGRELVERSFPGSYPHATMVRR